VDVGSACVDICQSHWRTCSSFLHSCLCQLFWPPWCRARKCEHFTASTVRSPMWR